MWELMGLLGLIGGGWWIWDGIVARERAVAAARRACDRHQQQLLDETVEQVQVRFVRSGRGALLPLRRYRFEFTADGDTRHSGQLAIHGRRVLELQLALPEFTLYDDE